MMADRHKDLPSTALSTGDLWDKWKFAGESALNESAGTVDGSDSARGSDAAGTMRAAAAQWEDGQSFEAVANFALDSPTTYASVLSNSPDTIDLLAPAPAGLSAPHAGRPPESVSHDQACPLQPGAEVAGFRLILELGRGAFARVYLAEEINLGRRLVAVKVSRPDGDEPQILARLQHAHIVPVHSVYDEPTCGYRFLCMPYFGGADLARVLRAGGGLVSSGHDGGSLVRALDQVSRKVSDGPGPLSTPRSSRRLHSSHTNAPRPRSQMSGAIWHKAVPLLQSSPLGGWFRLSVGSADARSRFLDVPAGEREEPSRQFLRGASAIEAAVWITERLAEGLQHAHDRGLLHRDLKPSNILLAADGTPMLLDFNLAVETPTGPPEVLLERALVGGTLPYMSPEHIDAFNPCGTTRAEAVDERSDIYALGLIFFELLAGASPFPDPATGKSLSQILELMIACRRRPVSLRSVCPQVPWSLDALAAKCLAFDPSQRYDSAGEMAEDLRRFLENLPMKHCPEPSLRERMGKWARRHPGLCGSTSIALIAVLLLGLLGGAVTMIHGKMQQLSARVRYRVFDQDFTETQFLLNTAGDSNDFLKKGLEKAGRLLARLGESIDPPERLNDWVQRLTPKERGRLHEQFVELNMLEARAQVMLATKRGSGDERRRAIERAIDRLDCAERIDQTPPSALFAERARYHAALGQTERAKSDQKRSSRITPTSCHDLTLLATTRLSGGDHLGAEQALSEALHRDVTSFWAWFVMGHCHFTQGRFLEAAGDFSACAARSPDFAWVHFNRGLALARAGRALEARNAYDRALDLDPLFSEAFVNRAMVLLELNQPGLAERDLLRAIELGRDDLVVMTSLGEALARMDRRQEAEDYFASLLARNPSSLVVRVARGFTRITPDPAGALSDLELALEQAPRHAHAHYGMALLLRASDPRKALGHLDQALQTDPNLIDAVQVRALIRARLGEPAALDDVERLLQSPTHYHLYNAACAVALYAQNANLPRFAPRALELLSRAIDLGYPGTEAASDPDLKWLRQTPGFERVITRRAR